LLDRSLSRSLACSSRGTQGRGAVVGRRPVEGRERGVPVRSLSVNISVVSQRSVNLPGTLPFGTVNRITAQDTLQNNPTYDGWTIVIRRWIMRVPDPKKKSAHGTFCYVLTMTDFGEGSGPFLGHQSVRLLPRRRPPPSLSRSLALSLSRSVRTSTSSSSPSPTGNIKGA
jgi:hypothetical protein